jgi:hypothetical protein
MEDRLLLAVDFNPPSWDRLFANLTMEPFALIRERRANDLEERKPASVARQHQEDP